ncbi:MAG: hypothetical protein ABR543_18940 [Gemmatimonadaceae bacterium]
MTAGSLERALTLLGVVGTVEARGSVAILIAADASPLSDPVVRDSAVALALQYGFTNLALELKEDDEESVFVEKARDGGNASLRRD